MEDLESIARQRFEHLKRYGRQISGASDREDSDTLPTWIDRAKFATARETIRNNIVSIFFSHLCGLIMVVQLPDGLFPLLVTRKSRSLASLFNRYLSTMQHVKCWYDEDVFDTMGIAHKSLSHVRRMHRIVGQTMNKKDGDRRDRLWVSQFDMVMTQWSFIGLALSYPKQCGLHLIDERKHLEDINYAWRVLGYLCGIDDEFNLCAGSYTETRLLCQMILKEIYQPVLTVEYARRESSLGYQMSLDIIDSLRAFFFGATANLYLKYWYEQFDGFPIPTLNSKLDRTLFRILKFVMNVALKFRILRAILNFRLGYRLRNIARRKVAITKQLSETPEFTRYNVKKYFTQFSVYKNFVDLTTIDKNNNN